MVRMTLHVGWDSDFEGVDPSWDAVSSAIRSMDNSTRDQVLLSLGDMRFLVVGGGSGAFVVSSQEPDKAFSVQNPDGVGEVRVQSGGQAAEFPASIVVGEAVALRAARYYLETGRTDPGLVWAPD